MQDRAVTDMTILFHDGVLLRKTVHDAVVLNIGTVADNQPAKVTTKAGVWADIHVFTDDHIANQHRGRVDIAAGVYDWR
jgi:hypothetical protein